MYELLVAELGPPERYARLKDARLKDVARLKDARLCCLWLGEVCEEALVAFVKVWRFIV